MTETLAILAGAFGMMTVTFAGLVARSWWKQRGARLQQQTRAALIEAENMRRLAIVVAVHAAGRKDGTLRIPKATVASMEDWAITPQARKDGGLDVKVGKRDTP